MRKFITHVDNNNINNKCLKFTLIMKQFVVKLEYNISIPKNLACTAGYRVSLSPFV